MGGIFGGKPDNSALEREIAERRAETERLRKQAEEERREVTESIASRRRAGMRGGNRMLLSDVRLNPEQGIQTLGAGERPS